VHVSDPFTCPLVFHCEIPRLPPGRVIEVRARGSAEVVAKLLAILPSIKGLRQNRGYSLNAVIVTIKPYQKFRAEGPTEFPTELIGC